MYYKEEVSSPKGEAKKPCFYQAEVGCLHKTAINSRLFFQEL